MLGVDKKDVAWWGVVSIETKESPELIELFSKVRTWPLDKNPEEDRDIIQYYNWLIEKSNKWSPQKDWGTQFNI